MKKRSCYLAAISLLVLLTSFVLLGCVNKLTDPVFAKKLVCSMDMDTEIEIITASDFKLKAVDIDIPDMPEELQVVFYDDTIEVKPELILELYI